MAASQSIMAQEVYLCNFCGQAAEICCKSCQAYLCLHCVPEHLIQLKDERHDIVPFKKRRKRKCELHPGQRCEAYCQNCEVHVCLSCLIGEHRLHDVAQYPVVIQSETENEEEANQSKCFILLVAFRDCVSSALHFQLGPVSRLITCAILFTIGLTLYTIGCARFKNYPSWIVIFYVFFGLCSSFIHFLHLHHHFSGLRDVAIFLATGAVVSANALTIVLAKNSEISVGACILSIFSNIFLFPSIYKMLSRNENHFPYEEI
ncbi:uncharacterized protein LOC134231817 [Saccostrea cucullata]|uniref:uncharacterized protein LOC134231817 n=1 Tax=Saccostrea cuccullata TaxID=36930 RepID=UPI002ED5FCE4